MLSNYFKIAIRNLHRHAGYSLINILGLAIGMACCLLILLYVQDELSYDRYHANADQTYRVIDRTRAVTTPALAPAMKNAFPEIEEYTRFKPPFGVWMMRYEDRVFYEGSVYWTDTSVFDMFDFPLIQGDPATALREPNTVVITESMASKYFGDEDPMGKILSADDDFLMIRVTGVMKDIPLNTHLRPDFFFSIASMPGFYHPTVLETWDDPVFYTYIRLSPGTSPDALESKLPAFIDTHVQQEGNPGATTLVPSLQPLTDIYLHSQLENELSANSDIAYIYILLSVAVFMLLIACINFMNMATARSARRAREVGLRKVVGASRLQLIRQFLGESILIAMFALFLAVALVQMVLPTFNAFTGKEVGLAFGDAGLLFGLAGIALFAGTVAGSYPAFFLSGFQPNAVLKESVKTGGANVMVRKSLVVVQFAISTILIIGTGVVYEQLDFVHNKRLGFDKEHVITVPAAITPIFQRLQSFENALKVNASVLGVTAATSLPGRSGGTGILQQIPIRPAGYAEEKPMEISGLWGQSDFISTLGLDLAAGRGYWQDNAAADSSSIMFNEAAARHFGWSSEAAIGKQIDVFDRRMTVVGIVKDFHMRSLHSPIEPLVIMLGDGGNHIAIRIEANTIASTLNFIENTWQAVYPDYPYIYSFLDEDFDQLYRNETKLSELIGVFSLMTVFIACLGLLGLASFTAEQRTKEIGVRKVLGASISSIMLMLSREVVALILLSNVVAWLVAFVLMDDWLRDFAYRIEMGIGPFVLGGILTLAIALLTVSYQAARAARTNPVDSLRQG